MRQVLGRVGPWVGLSTSPVALVAGGGVAEGLRGWSLVVALVVGSLLLATLAGAQGVVGQRTGRPLASITADTLGTAGSRWVGSVVMLAMMLGWFGVNAGLAGVATGRLVGLPDPAGIALFAAVLLAVALRGLGVLSWAGLAAGVAATALAAYGMALVLDGEELTLSGGLTASQPMSLAAGITLMVGYGAAFSLRTPDFTHDLARASQVVACALWGLGVPLIGFATAGALLYAATGEWDLAEALRALGSADLAYLFVAVGFTGSVLTNIWSGGLALRDVAPAVGRITAMVAVTALGAAAAAAGLADRALDWLTLMALAAPGLVVLCVLARDTTDGPRPAWRMIPLSAWAMGIVCAIGLQIAGSSFALPAAALIPAAAFLLLMRLTGRHDDPTPEKIDEH
ncbi:MAG: cytosine permease, partial [Miltoncostaeaceae bacterium]